MSLIPRWVDGKGSQTFYSKHQPCCPLLLQTSGLMKLYPKSVVFPCTFAAAAASVTVVAVSDSLLSREQLLPTVPLLWQVKKMWLFFPGLLQYFTALEVREAKCEKGSSSSFPTFLGTISPATVTFHEFTMKLVCIGLFKRPRRAPNNVFIWSL